MNHRHPSAALLPDTTLFRSLRARRTRKQSTRRPRFNGHVKPGAHRTANGDQAETGGAREGSSRNGRAAMRTGTPAVASLTASPRDRKSTRLNSSHVKISYAV